MFHASKCANYVLHHLFLLEFLLANTPTSNLLNRLYWILHGQSLHLLGLGVERQEKRGPFSLASSNKMFMPAGHCSISLLFRGSNITQTEDLAIWSIIQLHHWSLPDALWLSSSPTAAIFDQYGIRYVLVHETFEFIIGLVSIWICLARHWISHQGYTWFDPA